MKKPKQIPGLDHKSSLNLLLLGALFLEIIVTKVVILIRPDMDPWGNASDINKFYMASMALLVIPLWLKTPLVIHWGALRFPKGKKLRREILETLGISAVLVLGMIGIRLWMNAHDPEAAARPWFGLYLNIHGRWFYPFSAILQELLVKALVQENIRRVNPSASIHRIVLLTGLFFAVLHMNYPLYYLLGAGLMCALTGYLYERDGNLWGSVVIHFILGFLPRALGLC